MTREYRNLTKRENEELGAALKIAEEVAERIKKLQAVDKAVDIDRIWDLRNQANEVGAVLCNIHDEVYR